MRGPAIDVSRLRPDRTFDASLRVLSFYMAEIDAPFTRIDVRVNGEQFNVAFQSGTPIPPKAGDKIDYRDDLLTPANGVLQCFNVKASLSDIISALTELINDLKLAERW